MFLLAVEPCTGLKPVWQLVGYILLIFKIVIPILIIIFGAIDLGKAVVASKSDEIKNAAKSLMFRALAGVFIFFIPTLVGFVFSMVGEWSELQTEYEVCQRCITSPGNCNK